MTEKLIGGVQGFGNKEVSSIGTRLLASSNGHYNNARSALYAITKVSSFRRIWLPSYLCDSVLLPFVKAGIEIDFYTVDRKLVADFDEVSIEIGDAVLLISYFGVPTDQAYYVSLKAAGACIIEDLSQALYSTPCELADYSVYSLRKFIAVPDGGVVVANRVEVSWPYASSTERGELLQGIEAIAGRSLFDAGLSNSKKWVSDFQESEARMTTDLLPMSLFTRSRFGGAIDFQKDQIQRITNFDYLLSELSEIALIQDRKGAVPLGFPIVVADRDKVRAALFEQEIYPPVHWRIEGVVPSEFIESHLLSSQIMTIPCDGRYNLTDMRRVVDALRVAV